ncbi:hypothetical protein QF030_001856 [Streptomyces rishiriensis]|uniref:Uncharacterized protein n=1 Tax=Streptomyces rishiriensis TaxID=68264 RepID=A0ABU0NKM2_STRRH|nr:hypothetical protein [Streptomyces rishiriensis]
MTRLSGASRGVVAVLAALLTVTTASTTARAKADPVAPAESWL